MRAGDHPVAEQVTAFAPGRVNLIGEHTDYNRGLALPFAINEGVTVTAHPGRRGMIDIVAVDLDGRDTFALDAPPPTRGWRAFARGAVAELQAAGARLTGARLRIEGTVPRGSGLSSSAALEVALCLALLGIADAEVPDRLTLAQLCSRVENDWVGAQTGLLDQISSLCGESERALKIDFDTLDVTPVPLPLGDHTLVTLDSGERHTNAKGADGVQGHYNQRRSECAQACTELGIGSLREANLADADGLPEPLGARVRHIVSENERVRATVAALDAGDLRQVGELLNASHVSLRDDFAISTPAVEATIERLRDAGAIGARIMGGGFGGHVLGLLPPGAAAPEDATAVIPGPGAHRIS
jgi:galactokinase